MAPLTRSAARRLKGSPEAAVPEPPTPAVANKRSRTAQKMSKVTESSLRSCIGRLGATGTGVLELALAAVLAFLAAVRAACSSPFRLRSKSS